MRRSIGHRVGESGQGPRALSRAIAIIGAGGFAREVLWLLAECGAADRVGAFYETDGHWRERHVAGLPVRPVSELEEGTHTVIALGAPSTRQAIRDALPDGLHFPSFIHPNARIGPRVEIGEGVIVCAGCILTCDIELHAQVQLNLATTIGHDCVLQSFATTAPAVNISGNCRIGQRCYLGTNACLRDGLSLPADTVVGMGAVMVSSPDAAGVYVGNPARRR